MRCSRTQMLLRFGMVHHDKALYKYQLLYLLYLLKQHCFQVSLKSVRLTLSFRSGTGSEFQKHGPAAEKLLSPSRMRVLCTIHVN